jgi:hypothetical protein
MAWDLDGDAYELASVRGAPVAYQPTSEDAVTPQFVETTPETLDDVLRDGGFTLIAVRTVTGGPSDCLGIFENAEGQRALIGLMSA